MTFEPTLKFSRHKSLQISLTFNSDNAQQQAIKIRVRMQKKKTKKTNTLNTGHIDSEQKRNTFTINTNNDYCSAPKPSELPTE